MENHPMRKGQVRADFDRVSQSRAISIMVKRHAKTTNVLAELAESSIMSIRFCYLQVKVKCTHRS
jgi:hypothetical protein